MENALIRLQSVAVTLDGQRVLDHVDLTVAPGEAVAVIGPNGSGKTTLLRVLATLTRPNSGAGEVLGADLTGPVLAALRSQIGFITHTPGLLEELTLRENLTHFCRISGKPEDACDRALEAVGLERVSGRSVARSSFGMKRRAEIAWLLISKPKVLLLDEARSGLDQEAKSLVDALTRLTLEREGAVVEVSHEAHGLGQGIETVHQLRDGSLKARA